MATFPGKPPNPLGAKIELNLAGSWTDITAYTKVSAGLNITNMGRADESSSISASQLTLTLKNDGRFTPKNSAGAYYPNILRNTQVRVSVNATSTAPLGTADGTFESGVASWSPTSATFAQSSTQKHSGGFSGLLTVTGTPAQAFVRPTLAASAPVTVGTSYTASGWLYSAAGYASVQFAVDWFTSGGVYLSTTSGPGVALSAGTWQFYTVTGTAPATAAFGLYGPSVFGSPPAGTAVFLDDAVMTPAANAYAGSRFYGEISSWPPGQDVSGRDSYVQVTASGIWRRISASSASIGSAYTRYVQQLTGTSVPAAYWPMEDGSGSTAFVPAAGSGSNMTFSTVAPQFSADSTDFAGSDALPQMNAARMTATVTSAATPTSNMVRFALSVPAAGDSTGTAYTSLLLARILTSGTIATLSIWLLNSGTTGAKLQLNGYNSGGTLQFTGTIATPVNGIPVLVSAEMTATTWALKIIKPGAGAVLDQVTGSHSQTVAAVTSVQPSQQGLLTDTVLGQFGVWYVTTPSIVTAAAALGGFAGEFAVDRFTRLCAEQGIATTVIGSASAAMGPQADDTLASILQSIEDTDGGLLFESRDQFGLEYRTLASLQNQASPVTLNYAGGVLGATLAPVYDDQLVKNQWTVTNTDGYAAQATLTSGAVSIAAVPNGVGVYAGTASTNANTHAQVNAIAQQRLFLGTVDDVRYPAVTMAMARAQAAPLFSTVPSLRIGDYIQVTNIPATMGGASTSKQLVWGYSETISHNQWTIVYNAVPELPFETSFNPGVYSVTQAPSGAVATGSTVGASVSAAQLAPGLAGPLSARTIGGMTSFIAASTPYDWSFAVTGTPSDVTYFTCTEVQSQPIAAGDTFTNTGGFGGPFTVTSVDPPSGGNVTVHFTPDASSVMSSGTVHGGKNGDTWVNTSGGNQVNVWGAGAWTPVTWNASSVIAASSITASLIAAGIVVAGIIDGTEVDGALFRTKNASGATIMTINKSAGTWVQYLDTGSATQGKPSASSGSAPFTDEFSNSILGGTATYTTISGTIYAVQNYLGNTNYVSAPNWSNTWDVYTSLQPNTTLGSLSYLDTDGNTYRLGAWTQRLANNFTVNTTTATQLPGMLFDVGVGSYNVTGYIRVQAGSSGTAQPMVFQLHSSATVTNIAVATNAIVEAQGTTSNPGYISALGTNPSVITGPAANNLVFDWFFDGTITFSAAGNLGLFVAQATSAADETFTVQANNRTWWRLEPQT